MDNIFENAPDALEEINSSFFQHLLDQFDGLVFVKDAEHRMVYVNEAFADFIGQPRVNYIGKKTREIFESDEHFEVAEKQDEEVLRREEGYTFKAVQQYAARPGIHMRLTKRKFCFREKAYIVGLLVDISALKNSQQQLQKSNEELEEKINQIQKTETKLIESEKMASIGHLTAGLAHEIGNPINYVAGSVIPIQREFEELTAQLDLLKEARESGDLMSVEKSLDHLLSDQVFHSLKEINQLLNHIEEGSDRVKHLLESLKSFSITSEAKTTLTDINQLINHTLKLLAHTVASGVSIATVLSEDVPKFYTNAGQLAQVLMHLIKNALQSLKGYGRVLVKTSYTGEEIQILVQDDGEGMSEEVRKNIFEPFFTTREVGKGTGLGLSISLSIIRQLGGQIEVKSEKHKGTSVLVKIPVEV